MKYLISLALITAFASSASAGEITRTDTTANFKWKSTECPKPIPKSAASGLSSEDRLMAYATDIEIYIDCIQREAQRDFDKTQTQIGEAIQTDLQKEVNVMNDMMLNAAKTMR
ncbi:MAG: hypothetical protein ABJN69_01315 [Hellea sp.]